MQDQSLRLSQTFQQSIKIQEKHPLMTPKFIDLYKNALETSSLNCEQDLKWRNVIIYEQDHIHELYTIGDNSHPHLVLLHGYGGTSLTFIKTLKHLKIHFQIHALDSFGVGLSSRGNWRQQMSYEETKNYFIDAIEQWRKKVGISNFILAGHSFGGYVASLYFQRYSKRVDHLVLLSPAGTARSTQEQIRDRASKWTWFFHLCHKLWYLRFSPLKTYNVCFIGSKLLDSVVEQKLKIPEEQRDCWKGYLRWVGDQQHCSEIGIFYLFQWPLQPMRSIELILDEKKCQVPITFLYGDDDWMQPSGALRLQRKYSNVTVHTVRNAGHQILFDNPEEVARIMRKMLIDNPESGKMLKESCETCS